MKKKLIYLMLLILPASLISTANQCSNWPGYYNLVKSHHIIKKQDVKKEQPDFDINPGSWFL